jgi:Pex2 / Pex12 amino terminal region
MEPGAARRAVLVALQSLAPYCMARWAPAVPDREDSGSWRNDSPMRMATAATGPESAGGLPPLPHQRLWQQVSTLARATPCLIKPYVMTNALEERRRSCSTDAHPAPAQVTRHAAEAWRWLGCYSGEAARLHLALFYIYGTYYEWPKRLAGESPRHEDRGTVLTTHL